MSCPTCDHTMQGLLSADDCDLLAPRFFWCPRCGTLRTQGVDGERTVDESPKLVERCRRFRQWMRKASEAKSKVYDEWCRYGIAESITKPEDRE